jgi:hypothetical protein
MMQGYLGQFVVIVPSEHLIIVRFGLAPGADFQGVGLLVRDVIAATRQEQYPARRTARRPVGQRGCVPLPKPRALPAGQHTCYLLGSPRKQRYRLPLPQEMEPRRRSVRRARRRYFCDRRETPMRPAEAGIALIFAPSAGSPATAYSTYGYGRGAAQRRRAARAEAPRACAAGGPRSAHCGNAVTAGLKLPEKRRGRPLPEQP